jgi:hypothetical protein
MTPDRTFGYVTGTLPSQDIMPFCFCGSRKISMSLGFGLLRFQLVVPCPDGDCGGVWPAPISSVGVLQPRLHRGSELPRQRLRHFSSNCPT